MWGVYMSRRKKTLLLVLSVILGLIVIWRIYAVSNTKYIDARHTDGRKAAANFSKVMDEYRHQQEEEHNADTTSKE